MLTGPDPNGFRCGRSKSDITYGKDILVIEKRFKSCAVIGCFPESPVSSCHIKCIKVRLFRILGYGKIADPGSAAKWSQVPVCEVFE